MLSSASGIVVRRQDDGIARDHAHREARRVRRRVGGLPFVQPSSTVRRGYGGVYTVYDGSRVFFRAAFGGADTITTMSEIGWLPPYEIDVYFGDFKRIVLTLTPWMDSPSPPPPRPRLRLRPPVRDRPRRRRLRLSRLLRRTRRSPRRRSCLPLPPTRASRRFRSDRSSRDSTAARGTYPRVDVHDVDALPIVGVRIQISHGDVREGS